MSRFTDKLCPVCRVRFTDNSDIVVCPECGTPHHRACYAKTGSCAVGGYHAEGFVWNGMLPDEMEISAICETNEKTIENVKEDKRNNPDKYRHRYKPSQILNYVAKRQQDQHP